MTSLYISEYALERRLPDSGAGVAILADRMPFKKLTEAFESTFHGFSALMATFVDFSIHSANVDKVLNISRIQGWSRAEKSPGNIVSRSFDWQFPMSNHRSRDSGLDST
jgi:hypothetical protein